jgi:hypothetical protein
MEKAQNRKLVYIGIAVLGAILVWWGTARGAGIGGDATIYLTSAENFANGQGLGIFSADGTFRLIPYFPPFFPIVLSSFALIGLDLAIVARFLNLILFAATIFLVLKASDDYIADWRYGIGLGLLLALSPVLNPVFSWAMSEPLSIFLGTFAIILILKYFQQDANNKLLVISALLAGFSTLTRYGAIVYTAVICLLLLFFEHGRLIKRLGRAVLYGIIAIVPTIVWAIIDYLHTDTVSSRSVNALTGALQRVSSYFGDLKSVFLFWFIPDSWIQAPFYPQILNIMVVLIFIVGLTCGSWFLLKQTKENKKQFLFGTMLISFCVLYILMTLIISLATYPPITIGTRMFAPLYVMAFWLIVYMLYQLSLIINGKRLARIGLLGLFGVFVLWSGFRGLRIIQDNHQTGLGFQSVEWQSSDLVAYVKQLPEEQIIITNEEMALYALTGRNAYPFAEVYFDEPLTEFTRYGEGKNPSAGENLFVQREAYLVLFDSIYTQYEGLYTDQSENRVEVLTNGLELIYQGEDGIIYQYPAHIEE